MKECVVSETLSGLQTSQRTDDELARDEKVVAGKYPFYLMTAGHLFIKTKSAELIRLVPNSCQQALMDIIKAQRAEGRPVRIWILKARQEGVSTEIEGVVYSITSQVENINALIMADDKEHASNLFEMSKLYQEKLEENINPYLAPVLKKSNEKKLEFEDIHSQIIIATAENADAARSHTFQIVHLSEISKFRDFDGVMTALAQSVPDLPNTIIIGETTANGMDKFYDEWIRAIEGKTDWIPVFIPWFWMKEYSMPLVNGQLHSLEGIKFTSEMSKEVFIHDEVELKAEFNLTDEQLNWRRYAIINKCHGDMVAFNTEYPATWQDAFNVSGVNFFDVRGMQKQKAMEKIPIDIGEIFYENTKYTWRSLPEGRIRLFERPGKYEQYMVAEDASEALGQDEASILVGNVRTNRTAATVSGQYPPGELAHVGVMLANYFNGALIIPENKGYGYAVCQDTYKVYGNIYRKTITKKGRVEATEELGFNTNAATRPEMLARLSDVIRLNSIQLLCKEVINQCMTFVTNPTTLKPEAASGKQDGLVICAAIFQQVREERPYRVKDKDVRAGALKHDLERQNRNGGFGFE